MMTMLEWLPLVTLMLTLVSSPSHGSLHHTQQGRLNDLLVDQEDMQLPAEVSKLSEGSVLRLLVPNRLRQHQSMAAEFVMRSRKPSPFLDSFIPVRDLRGPTGYSMPRGKRTRTSLPLQYVLEPLADNNGVKKSPPPTGFVITGIGKKRDTMSE